MIGYLVQMLTYLITPSSRSRHHDDPTLVSNTTVPVRAGANGYHPFLPAATVGIAIGPLVLYEQHSTLHHILL